MLLKLVLLSLGGEILIQRGWLSQGHSIW